MTSRSPSRAPQPARRTTGWSSTRPRDRAAFALVDRDAQAAVGVLVEQRLTGADIAEGHRPGQGTRRPGDRRLDGRPGGKSPERPFEVTRQRAQLHVAEGVDIDDLGDERAVAQRRGRRRGDGTRVAGSSAGPSASSATPVVRCAAAGAKMSRPWKLDEMTGRRYCGRRQLDRLGDPAEAIRRSQQQSVVRPDQDVAARRAHGHRPACRPDARVDDSDVERRPGGTAAHTTGAARRRGSGTCGPRG